MQKPIQKMMKYSKFSTSTFVKSTKNDKQCALCDNIIPKGSTHTGAILINSRHYQVSFCNKCEIIYKDALSDMRASILDAE